MVVQQVQQVRIHLVTERLGVGSPPGRRVSVATVAFCGCGHQELRGRDEARQEVITEPRQKVVTRRLCGYDTTQSIGIE